MIGVVKIAAAMATTGVMTLASIPGEASAATISFLPNDQQGSDALDVDLTITDIGTVVQFDLTVNTVAGGGNIADLRGFFFDIGGTFGSGYTALGADITAFEADKGNVNNLGGGVNINGSGQDRFDFGVAFGSPGIGSNDIQSTSFLFGLTGGTVTSADFFGQKVAIRGTSTGLLGSSRDGSSKTGGTVSQLSVIPLPGTGWLLIAGLGGLGAMRRFRKS